jgi:glycerol uptake facilitator-like aquaporin
MSSTRPQRLIAEGLGTALLIAAVVGSGIMGMQLADGNSAIALLANAIATAAVLVTLVLTFGGVSGAHFNPAVTVSEAVDGVTRWSDVPGYLAAQLLGAVAGVMAAHGMFGRPLLQASQQARQGLPLVFSEFVATFGLLVVIKGCARRRPADLPYAVGLYIAGAYWFTASTSFANPAVTVGRTLTGSFAGIRGVDAPWFIAAQMLGAAAATWLCRWMLSLSSSPAGDASMLERRQVRA